MLDAVVSANLITRATSLELYSDPSLGSTGLVYSFKLDSTQLTLYSYIYLPNNSPISG